jgi:divalent metal cation (Fe/Co/Zn/Cd) transporter
VDTVRAWYFGARFLVEIHVVLDADTPLREAHDVGEKLELMVVRALIHWWYKCNRIIAFAETYSSCFII